MPWTSWIPTFFRRKESESMGVPSSSSSSFSMKKKTDDHKTFHTHRGFHKYMNNPELLKEDRKHYLSGGGRKGKPPKKQSHKKQKKNKKKLHRIMHV